MKLAQITRVRIERNKIIVSPPQLIIPAIFQLIIASGAVYLLSFIFEPLITNNNSTNIFDKIPLLAIFIFILFTALSRINAFLDIFFKKVELQVENNFLIINRQKLFFQKKFMFHKSKIQILHFEFNSEEEEKIGNIFLTSHLKIKYNGKVYRFLKFLNNEEMKKIQSRLTLFQKV